MKFKTAEGFEFYEVPIWEHILSGDENTFYHYTLINFKTAEGVEFCEDEAAASERILSRVRMHA